MVIAAATDGLLDYVGIGVGDTGMVAVRVRVRMRFKYVMDGDT